MVQRQEKPQEEEKKDPLTEGLKTTGEKLAEHEPFKNWYEPKLDRLKYTLWDKASPAEKAAMLTFLGLNLGTAAAAFRVDPRCGRRCPASTSASRSAGSRTRRSKASSTRCPAPGKSAYGVLGGFHAGDLTSRRCARSARSFPLSGATFGLESTYDPAGKGFSLTGGKFGLDFLGGGLKAEGKTFKDLSPYPLLIPGTRAGRPGSWLMQEVPGMPQIGRPGYQFMINADLLKLFPQLQAVVLTTR